MAQPSVRAIVVEDETSWQDILSENLSDLDMAVDVAADFELAVAALRRAPHRLAVVDLSLDGKDHRNQDGLRVLDAVRQYDPGCVAILLTGHATVEVAVSALTERGAFTCLRKETFTRAAFREVVQRALASPLPRLNPAVPRAASAEIQSDLASEQPAGQEMPARSALVVEDDAGWRSILAELLAEAGYRVQLCSGFAEALGCLGRERYDLAIADLSLRPHAGGAPAQRMERGAKRNLDGFRLLARARAANVPTIVVSGVASPAEIERTYADYGIFSCIEKQNFDRDIFLSTVRECQASTTAGDGLEHLTGRERQVLSLMAGGMSNKEIARALVISANTVKRHLRSIFDKLGVQSRAAAAARAVSAGMPIGWQAVEAPDAHD